MLKNYADEFREDLKEFHEMTRKFYEKEINVAQYKGFSGDSAAMPKEAGKPACSVCVSPVEK